MKLFFKNRMELFFNSIKASLHGIFGRSQIFLPQVFYHKEDEYPMTAEKCIESAINKRNAGDFFDAACDYGNAGFKCNDKYESAKKQLKQLKRDIKGTDDCEAIKQLRKDEECLRKTILSEIQNAERYFREARKIFENEGFHKQSRELYVYEKDAQRNSAWELKSPFWHNRAWIKSYSVEPASWSFLTTLKYSCKYGESIPRFAAIILIVILLFGIVYYFDPLRIFEFRGDGIR
jgi:hypothetical protein